MSLLPRYFRIKRQRRAIVFRVFRGLPPTGSEVSRKLINCKRKLLPNYVGHQEAVDMILMSLFLGTLDSNAGGGQ